jgi:hypothetical protein
VVSSDADTFRRSRQIYFRLSFHLFEPVGFNAHSRGQSHHDTVRHFQRARTTGVKRSGDFINFAMKTLSLLAAANNGVNTP